MTRVPTGASRERVSVELRGLGPAIRAHAKDRRLSIAALVRTAVVAMLKRSPIAVEEPGFTAEAVLDQPIKLTIRMHPGVARQFAGRARASGLSYGAYLTTLVDGTPAAALSPDHKQAVTALSISTDQLAAIAADVNESMRLIRRGTAPSVQQFNERMTGLAEDVRRHLGVASRLMAELKPAATRPGRASASAIDGQRVNP
ncbi:MAG: hypothetical protein ACREIB_11040 [Pseudomonadota bacterium]